MTTLSNSDLNSADVYGRYVHFVDTKRNGPKTPVRRSLRTRKGTPFPTKCDEVSISHLLEAVVDESNEGCDTVKESKEVCDFDSALDDLCTVFQVKLKVDNRTLDVKNTSLVISPGPKEGRYVTVKEDGANDITPVKRSARNIDW